MTSAPRLSLMISVVLAFIIAVFLYPSKDQICGYILLLSPFRDLTLHFWRAHINKYLDKRVIRPSMPIPEITADSFSMDALRVATENFRYPAVVRSLFNESRASKLWTTSDYLPSQLGEFQIPIVKDARIGTLQNDRVLVNFADSFREMMTSEYSTEYLFFPVKSRFTLAGISRHYIIQLL